MVKLTFALRRLPDLTREEFQRYWLEQHGPLVRSHAEVLGIRRYVQTHTAPDELQVVLRASRDAPSPTTGWPSSGTTASKRSRSRSAPTRAGPRPSRCSR